MISPETGTMDILVHLETKSRGPWTLTSDILSVKNEKQDAQIKKAQLFSNGFDISGQPEMKDFHQVLAQQLITFAREDETTKRKIVSLDDKSFVFEADISDLNPWITAVKK